MPKNQVFGQSEGGGDPVSMPPRLDFDVKGTAEHFTVTGTDGHSYEL